MFASNYKLKYRIMFFILCKIESENQFKKAKKFLRSKDLKISKVFFFYPKDLQENDNVFIYQSPLSKEFCVCTNEGLNKGDEVVSFEDWKKLLLSLKIKTLIQPMLNK